jgi:hypothetical protein
MEDIRSENKFGTSNKIFFVENEKEQYAHQLIQQSHEMIDFEEAMIFVNILLLCPDCEKNRILSAFDSFFLVSSVTTLVSPPLVIL